MRRVALLSLLCVAGCSDGSDCSRARYAPCDIRDATCRVGILAAVQCERGHFLDTVPPVRIIDQDVYRAELEADAATRTPTPHWDDTYAMLGMIPMDATGAAASIELSVMRVLAYYSERTASITIIDRGVAMSSDDDTQTLAHELVHAIQDQQFGLADYRQGATTSDELQARRMVVEGDARFFELLYGLRQADHRPENVLWAQFFARWEVAIVDDVGTSTAPLLTARSAYPYYLGARQLSTLWLAHHDPNVASRYFEMPPRSDLEFMRTSPPPSPPRCDPPPPPAGYDVIDDEALGVLAVIAMVDRSARSPTPSTDVATVVRTLAGDQLRIVGSADETAFAWRIRMTESATTLADMGAITYWASQPGHLARIVGTNDLLLVGSTDPAIAAGWTDALALCP